MGNAVPTQHPAVVLRSHHQQLRALLAVAMIAVVGLSAAVVVLATRDNSTVAGQATPVSAPAPVGAVLSPQPGTRYDGGPEEGSRGAVTAHQLGMRYDGGPEEGTRGVVTTPQQPGIRYDGGPEEGAAGR